jgi:hypothetical protein
MLLSYAVVVFSGILIRRSIECSTQFPDRQNMFTASGHRRANLAYYVSHLHIRRTRRPVQETSRRMRLD